MQLFAFTEYTYRGTGEKFVNVPCCLCKVKKCRGTDGSTKYKGPSQVRIKPKSSKTHYICACKNLKTIIHPELSLVLAVLACTKRVDVY